MRRDGRRRPLISFLCLAGLVWIVAASAAEQGPQSAPAGPRRLLRQAYEVSLSARTEQDYSEIIDLCQRALAAGADEKAAVYGDQLRAWAYNRRGELAADAGRDEAALEDFEKSVSLDGTRWRAIHNRGVSYALFGRYDEAAADFDKTIELRPDYTHAWFNRGELHSQQGQWSAAIQDYDEAFRLQPNDAAVLASRGHAHYRLGDYRAAVLDFTEAIRLAPASPAAYIHRGDVFAELARYNDAARDYRRALGIDPGYGRGYQSAAWLMATCPQERFRAPQRAVEAARKAIQLDGEADYRYLDTLAAAYAAAGQFDSAVETQDKALDRAADEGQEVIGELRRRRNLYQEGRPYRQPQPSGARRDERGELAE